MSAPDIPREPGTALTEFGRRSRPGPSHHPPSGTSGRLIVALTVGAGVAGVWLLFFPGQLPEATDIVGFPIWANFNIDRYFQVYNAISIVFPAAAVAAYAALSLANRRFHGGRLNDGAERDRLQPSELDDGPSPVPGRGARVMRAGLVGSVLGLEIAYTTATGGRGFWLTAVLAGAAYVGLVSVAAAGISIRRRRSRYWDRHSAVNALFVPLTILGLYGISRATRVTVLANGNVDSFPWMPLVVAAATAATAFLWVAIRLSRAEGRRETVAQVERTAIMMVAGPVLLFVLVARIPGAFGRMDVFHEGEWLAGARLVGSGRFPWRDLYFIHGPLQDILAPLTGMSVFEQSRWGALAGFYTLFRPAIVISFYLLLVRLVRGDWIFLAMTPAILPLGIDARFLLLPLALLLLIGLLRRPGRLRAMGLAAFLVAQSVLVPETAPFALAVGIVLVSFELYHREQATGIVTSVPRTLWFTLGAGVTVLGWAGYLVTRGALDDFLGYYLTFAGGHELTGGIPIQWGTGGTGLFLFGVVAPVASILVFGLFFAARLRGSRLTVQDWAVAALALFVVYFYRKFLSRADGHVYQVLQVSIPLILYVVYRTVAEVERPLGSEHGSRMARGLSRFRPLSLAVLAIAFLVGPGPVLRAAATMPDHFSAQAPEAPWLASLGYSTDDAIDRARLEDLKAVLAALQNPSGRIFDFTNQPAVFHYLLDYQPASRYYHVTMATRLRTQRDLLAELLEDPPEIAVFNATDGIPAWDEIPNTVRHYEISDFLLDRYRPVVFAAGNLLMLRKDLDPPPAWRSSLDLDARPITNDLYFRTFPCDWGYAPNFLEVDPPPAEAGAIELGLQPAPESGLEVDLPPGFRAYDWLELRSRSPLQADAFLLTPGAAGREIKFRTQEGAGTRYLVQVGSCPQWHGYARTSLLLLHDRPQDILSLRLLRSGGEDGAR